MAQIIAVEMDAYDPQLPGVRTLYFATQSFVSGPSDSPANTYYDGRIQQPASVQRTCFSDGRTFGRSQIGFGEMVLINNDGALDGLLNYSYSGRRILIRLGTIMPNQSSPTWVTVLRGTMEQAQFSWQRVTVRVRDRMLDIAQPLQQTRYAGTGTSLEGGDNIVGKPKPLVFGKVLNIVPTMTDESRGIYQISDNQLVSVDAVYDRGSTLTAGAAYTSQADMENNAPAANQYRTWNTAAGCYIRLGSAPVGTITVDAAQGASRTVGNLYSAILQRAGVSGSDISSADITALNAAVSYETGVFAGSEQEYTAIQLLDELCASVGAWYGADATGVFRIGQIVLPTGSAVGTITATDIIRIERVASRDPGVGIPAWKVKLGYQKVYTVQTDLGSAVSNARKQFVGERYRRIEVSDSAVKTANLLSPEIEFDTVLTSKTDATAEANRRLTIYKSRRDVYQATVRVDAALASVLDLGKIVTLQVNRFGMSAGQKFLITGIRTNLRGYLFDLTLWG